MPWARRVLSSVNNSWFDLKSDSCRWSLIRLTWRGRWGWNAMQRDGIADIDNLLYWLPRRNSLKSRATQIYAQKQRRQYHQNWTYTNSSVMNGIPQGVWPKRTCQSLVCLLSLSESLLNIYATCGVLGAMPVSVQFPYTSGELPDDLLLHVPLIQNLWRTPSILHE